MPHHIFPIVIKNHEKFFLHLEHKAKCKNTGYATGKNTWPLGIINLNCNLERSTGNQETQRITALGARELEGVVSTIRCAAQIH